MNWEFVINKPLAHIRKVLIENIFDFRANVIYIQVCVTIWQDLRNISYI